MGNTVAGDLGSIQLDLFLDTGPANKALGDFFNEVAADAKKGASAVKPVDTALSKLVKRAEQLGYKYDQVSRSFRNAFGKRYGIEDIQKRVKLLDKSLLQLQKTARYTAKGIQMGFKEILSGIPMGIGLAIGQSIIEPLTQLPSTVMNAAGETVQAFTDIDRALRQTLSIAGEDSEAFDQLSQFMLELAGTTKFTADELSNASVQLARAGLSVQELQDALPGIAAGAAAAGESVATMADVVVATLGGFGLEATETGMAVDILTNAANNSNTSVQELGEGLKYVAPIAKSLGISLEETAATAGLLANSGIKASQMGTALRTGLSRLAGAANGTNSEFSQLARGTGRMSTVLTKIGSDIVTTNGDLKDMPELLQSLRGGFEQLSSTERQLASKILFGDEAGSAWVSLLNTSAAETEAFFTTISNSSGVAAETAQKNLEGIAGSMDLLNSAISSVQAAFGKFFSTILKPFVDGMTALLNVFNSLPGPVQQAAIAVGAFAAAVAGAVIAIGIFKVAALAGVFAGIGTAASLLATQIAALASVIVGKVTVAFSLLTGKLVAFTAVVNATSFSLGGVATLLGGLMVKALTATAAGVVFLTGKIALLGGALLSLNFSTIIAGLGAFLKAITAGTAAVRSFMIAIGPVAATAALAGAAFLVFDTLFQGMKKGNEIMGDSKDFVNGLAKSLDGIVEPITDVERAYERKVSRVGKVNAALDVVREKLGLVTAEQWQLDEATISVSEAMDLESKALDNVAASLIENTQDLEKMTEGTQEYADKLRFIEEIQKEADLATQAQIRSYMQKIETEMDGRKSIEMLTEEEQRLVRAYQDAIANLETYRTNLATLGPTASAVAEDLQRVVEAVEDVKKRLVDANETFKNVKNIFQQQVGAMEEAFGNLQEQFREELEVEVTGIQETIDGIKEAEAERDKAFAEESRQRSRARKAQKQASDDRKRAIQEEGKAVVDAAQKELDAIKQANDDIIKGIERRNKEAKRGYEDANRARKRAHDEAMKDIDREIAAIDRRAEAANSQYDGQIDALKELTPAEEKLAALEKARLEAAAKGTGEEALRAQAQLERAEKEKQIAELEKQREAELAQIEAEKEAKEEAKRQKEEEFAKEKMAREDEFRAKERQNEIEIEALKAAHNAAEEAREANIQAKKEEYAQAVKNLEEEQRQRERENEAADIVREDSRRARKEATAARIKELEDDIENKKKAHKEAEEQREEEFTDRRKELERQYREAIGETSRYIIEQGDIAWKTYAREAIKQLKEVEKAAKEAAAAQRAADESSLTRSGALTSNFAGGPIDAGRLTYINELGQEAFLGESGKLELINKSPGAVWRAPEAGTIIPAHITKGLAIPSRGTAVATVRKSATNAAAAHGTADRNLMRLMGAINSSNDRIVNNVSVEAPNTVQAASDLMVELTKLKRRRLG